MPRERAALGSLAPCASASRARLARSAWLAAAGEGEPRTRAPRRDVREPEPAPPRARRRRITTDAHDARAGPCEPAGWERAGRRRIAAENRPDRRRRRAREVQEGCAPRTSESAPVGWGHFRGGASVPLPGASGGRESRSHAARCIASSLDQSESLGPRRGVDGARRSPRRASSRWPRGHRPAHGRQGAALRREADQGRSRAASDPRRVP
jgi:hypothetical protein